MEINRGVKKDTTAFLRMIEVQQLYANLPNSDAIYEWLGRELNIIMSYV